MISFIFLENVTQLEQNSADEPISKDVGSLADAKKSLQTVFSNALLLFLIVN